MTTKAKKKKKSKKGSEGRNGILSVEELESRINAPHPPMEMPVEIPDLDPVDLAREAAPELRGIETTAEKRERASECNRQIESILETFGCTIAPMLSQEKVGDGPSAKVLLSPTYGIFPLDR